VSCFFVTLLASQPKSVRLPGAGGAAVVGTASGDLAPALSVDLEGAAGFVPARAFIATSSVAGSVIRDTPSLQ
jgi:hypothetical protein